MGDTIMGEELPYGDPTKLLEWINDKMPNDRDKCDAIFKWADNVVGDESGKIELAEFWKLMMATNGMSDAEARQGLTEETFTENMMPAMGGGTGMDMDQLYRAYTEFGAGNIDEDFAAVFKLATAGEKLSDKEKVDAIFDYLDKNKSGKIELSEYRELIEYTENKCMAAAAEAMSEETWREKVMPAVGGGEALDRDQLFHIYNMCDDGDIHKHYAATVTQVMCSHSLG